MHDHIMIIGGTGMLFEASRSLAGRCRVLTSVARTERSLHALDAAVSAAGCTHHMLSLDWREAAAFCDALSRHVRANGCPSLLVAWLHRDTLAPEVAKAIWTGDHRCDFFHVRSSSVADPMSESDRLATAFDALPSMGYHQIVLGFHIEEGRSRWLYDAEISGGVLEAIGRGARRSIVGTVTPWSKRP